MRSFKGQGLPEHWVGQVTERGFRIEIFSKIRLKGGQTGSQVWESKRWEDPGSALGGQLWKPGQVTSPSPHSQSKVGVGRPDGWRNSEIKQTPEGSQSHHARHAGRPAGAEAVNGGRSRLGRRCRCLDSVLRHTVGALVLGGLYVLLGDFLAGSRMKSVRGVL